MAISYKTKVALQYQQDFVKYVRSETAKQGWHIDADKSHHYYMDCVFYFPRGGMDANNYFKCMADAITDAACVWIDDTQLCERVQGIYYDAKNPRVEIVIRPVEYIGVFASAGALSDFETRCHTCTRYGRNCSLLAAAKRGYVQHEICDGHCTAYTTKQKKEKTV